MGIEFIDRRRRDHVKTEGQKLFDMIINHAVVQTPSESYKFELVYSAHPPVIDDMVLQCAKDLCQACGATLIVTRTSKNNVKGQIDVSPATPLKVEKLKKLFWSRSPGKFVNKHTGDPVHLSSSIQSAGLGPVFTGSVREWYETFIETLYDARNSIEKVTKEAAETVYVGPDVLCILECSVLYRPAYAIGDSVPVHAGTLSNRLKVFKDESLKNSAFVVLVRDGVKYEVEVEVLDMNII